MSAATDAYMATTPLRFWPLTETSGTNANELVANEDGTCVGMVMGGADGPFGIGGKAPVFSGGSEHILLRTGAILGGQTDWSIGAWFELGGTAIGSRHLYGEANPTTGNNRIGVGFRRNSTTIMNLQAQHLYGADSGVGEINSASVYEHSFWAFYVWTRNGATIEIWRQGGRRTHSSGVASNTWTNSGVVSWIGSSPQLPAGTLPWQGKISHLALWDRVLTEQEINDIYEVCTPLTRELWTDPLWTPNAPWNQNLLNPLNPPALDPNGPTVVARLGNQINTYGTGNNAAGPIWTAEDTDPTERIRISGEQGNIADFYNTVEDHPLWDSQQAVPIPVAFDAVEHSDQQSTILQKDTHELWEHIELNKFLRGVNIGVVVTAGTLPVGRCEWYICGALADNRTGRLGSTFVTVNGSQGVHLFWTEVADAHHYNIYRYTPQTGMTNPPGAQLVGTTAAGVLEFVDDGSLTPGAFYPGLTAEVATWGCEHAGYIEDTDLSPGIWLPPRQGWGSTATALPVVAGTITLEEMLAGDIPHALTMSMAEVYQPSHVYPAQRNDGWYFNGNSIQEGTRFQLDPAFDIDAYFDADHLYERVVFRAVQKYGAFVRDVSQRPAFYIEEQAFLGGRDITSRIFQGRYDYEVFNTFPWDHFRVIDPAWTEAQAGGMPPDPPVIPKWGDFTEPFTTFDTVNRWSVAAGSAELAGEQLNLDSGVTFVTSRFTSDILESEVVVDVGSTGAAYAEGEAEIWIVNGILRLKMGVFDAAPVKLFIRASTSDDVETGYGAQPTFDPVTMRYWRIRETAGVIYFETSPDKAAWTQRASVTRAALGHTPGVYQGTSLFLISNAYGGSPPVLPDFVIRGVNVLGEVVAPPTPPKWSTFVEEFNFFDTIDRWTVAVGSASVSNAKLHLVAAPLTIVEASPAMDLLQSRVVVDVTSTGAAYLEGDAEIWLTNGALQLGMGLFVGAGPTPVKMFMNVRNSSNVTTQLPVTPVYDEDEHRYWRIREASGTIFFETSPDGTVWTQQNTATRASLGHAASAYESLTLQIWTNAYGEFPPTLPDFIIGGVNAISAPVGIPDINLPTSVLLHSRDTELVFDGD